MKYLNVYNAYLDDGHDVYKIIVPAENKKDAASYVSGNGEIIAIKEDVELAIHTDQLINDLNRCGWGQAEIDLIVRTLARNGVDYTTREMLGKAYKGI